MNELANALKRLLSKPQHPHGPWLSYRGHWYGKVGDLFSELVRDERYFAVANRPHEVTEFRAELKRSAKDLHAAGVIVTLDKSKVTLDLAKSSKPATA